MEFSNLGFDDWFRDKQKESGKDGYDVARVTAVNRDNYLVRHESGEVLAELAGEFMFSAETGIDFPAVGDWAFVRYFNSETLAIIYDLLPRKTMLRRKTAGKKVDYQMIATNIDVAFIIQSCDFNFNLRRLERYLVMVRDGNIEPIILLSKADLVSQEELEQSISDIRNAKVDGEIIAYSSLTGLGLPQIQHLLEHGKTYCLLGSSGVGKTTLLNKLVGREAFETNLVREKDGKGRHTTARRQLIVLDGGAMLVDTPGIRELGNIDVGTGIGEIFADIGELAGGCRFNDCTHTGEAGCVVLRAVRDGELDEARYQSYLKLLKESEHYQMSYAEKRKKDKKFSKFIKSAGKDIKRFKGKE
ncbi:ribosome small subunit-dependent GTPase A [Chloroflexota bacterium]